MDFATLYEEDIETWAEIQVAALRRLAATPGPWANAVDVENVVEEIEDLGSSQRAAVESLLQHAFAHAMKLLQDPASLSAKHWRAEVRGFLRQARKRLKPAVSRRIDLDEVWTEARVQAGTALEAFDRSLDDIPEACPFTIAEIADPTFDLLGELATVRRAERGR
jgi:hypothetical protein